MSYNSTSQTIIDTGTNDGVSFHDIQQPLDTKENRLGGLCKHLNINPWAKYKPVVYMDGYDTRNPILNTVSQWSFTDNAWKGDSTWWKGYPNDLPGAHYNCGFLIHQYTSAQDLLSDFLGSRTNYGWTYITPSNNEGYRTTDFARYRQNATPMFSHFISVKDIYSEGLQQNDPVTLSIDNTVSNDQDFLSWADFPDLSNYYFGVIVWKNDTTATSTFNVITMSQKIGDLQSSNSCQVQFYPDSGKYFAIPFLSKDSVTTLRAANPQQSFCIGSFDRVSFEVTMDSRAWISIPSFSWQDSFNGLSVEVPVTFKTWRNVGEGNYDNKNKVAIYSVTIKLINKPGRAIPPETSSNTATYTFNSTSSTPVTSITCNASDAATTTHTFTLSKANWESNGFTNFNYIHVSARVYKGTWDDTTLEFKDAVLGGDVTRDSGTIDPSDRPDIDLVINTDTESEGSIDKKPGGFPTGQHDNDNNIP